MSLPIAPVVKPSDLNGITNGAIPEPLLVTIGGFGDLHHLAARAWNALVVNAWAHAGMPMVFTWGGLYRTYAQQETLFRQRYAIGAPGGGCKRWNGELWCKKQSGLATAATPGTSNHGWGLAIDCAYDSDLQDGVSPDDATYIKGHAGWQWLLDNAHMFGFSWELQDEPWHLRYVAGDAIPLAVLDWEAFVAANPTVPTTPPEAGPVTPKPTPPTPTPIPPTGGTRMHWMNEIKKGAKNNTVTVMQTILYSLGYSIGVDGNFGSQSDGHIRTFQQRHGLGVDGVVGPKTWNALASDGPRNGEFDRG